MNNARPTGAMVLIGHHGCGESVLYAMARTIAEALKLPLAFGSMAGSGPRVVYINASSAHPPPMDPRDRAVHLIRDPRDVLAACWFHHQYATDDWLLAPRPELGGVGLGPHLRASSLMDGLKSEADFLGMHHLGWIRDWDYSNRQILETSYEWLWTDRTQLCHSIVGHFGITGTCRDRAVLALLGGVMSHPDGTMPGDADTARAEMWRWFYDRDLAKIYESAFGLLHCDLGYADWTWGDE